MARSQALARLDYRWHYAGFGTWHYKDYRTPRGALNTLVKQPANRRVFIGVEGEVFENSPKSPEDEGTISWRSVSASRASRWQSPTTGPGRFAALQEAVDSMTPDTIQRFRVYVEL